MAGKLAIAAGFVLFLCVSANAAQDEFARVEVQGMLHFDFDTHKASVDANGNKFDINFNNNRDLMRAADRFDKQIVLVSGQLSFADGMAVIDANRISGPRDANVRYETREVIREQPVIRERVIKEDKPLFKAGPLEIK